jgi:hypothetical protein
VTTFPNKPKPENIGTTLINVKSNIITEISRPRVKSRRNEGINAAPKTNRKEIKYKQISLSKTAKFSPRGIKILTKKLAASNRMNSSVVTEKSF